MDAFHVDQDLVGGDRVMDLHGIVQFAMDLDSGMPIPKACEVAGIKKRQAYHWLNRLEEWGVRLNSIAGLPGQYRVSDWGPINIKHYRKNAERQS